MSVPGLPNDQQVAMILAEREGLVRELARAGDRFPAGTISHDWWWLLLGIGLERGGLREAIRFADEVTAIAPEPPENDAQEQRLMAMIDDRFPSSG